MNCVTQPMLSTVCFLSILRLGSGTYTIVNVLSSDRTIGHQASCGGTEHTLDDVPDVIQSGVRLHKCLSLKEEVELDTK